MKTSTLIKWFASIVALIVSAIAVFGVVLPMLISSASDAGVALGAVVGILYVGGLLVIGNKFINSKKEAK